MSTHRSTAGWFDQLLFVVFLGIIIIIIIVTNYDYLVKDLGIVVMMILFSLASCYVTCRNWVEIFY